jgi:O-antigen ligase
MGSNKKLLIFILKNEELIFSGFLIGIAVSLIFWTLLNSILCLAFLTYWLFFVKKKFVWGNLKSRWIILFSLLYIIVVMGSLYSANTEESIFKLQQKSAFLFFPLILGTSRVLSPKLLESTLNAFSLAVLTGCIFCYGLGVYYFFKTSQSQDLYGYNLVHLKDMTPFTLGLCCLVAILHWLHGMFIHQNKAGRFKPERSTMRSLIGILLLFLFLLALGNRNILFISLGLIIFYCFRMLSALPHKVLLLAGMVVLTLFAFWVNPYLKKQGQELMDFSNQNGILLNKDSSLGKSWGGGQLRAAIWKCSWDVVKKHWVFGVGTGDAQDSLQAAYEKRKFYFASRYNTYNTHNQYLQETVTLGIPGLLVFLACLIMPLFVRFDVPGKLLYGLFVVSFLFACITDTPLELNKGIILYSFFNSLIFFAYYNLKLRPIHGNTRPKR